MIQARARNCFSREFLVSHNGNPLGHFRRELFSESIQINLLERRNLELRKTAFWGSRFSLVDLATGTGIAVARRNGIFNSAWQLELSSGTVFLNRRLFNSRTSVIEKDGNMVGKVACVSLFSRDWDVVTDDEIPIVDQLMIGLVHHVVQERRRRNG